MESNRLNTFFSDSHSCDNAEKQIQICPLRLKALRKSSGRSSYSMIVLPSRHSTCVTTRSTFVSTWRPGATRLRATVSLGNEELPCISGVLSNSNVAIVLRLAKTTPLRPLTSTKGKSVMWKLGRGWMSKQPLLSEITSSSFLMSLVARLTT